MVIETTEIERVSDAVRDLAGRDVSSATKGELLEAHEAVARLERVVGALAARFAGEIARRSGPDAPDGDLARGEGFGNAGKMISKVRGGTVPGARRSIDAGGAFVPRPAPPAVDGEGADALLGLEEPSPPAPKYPVIAEASLAGDLSVDAAGLIVNGLNSVEDSVAAAVLQEMEPRLVAKARTLAAHEVRKMVARAVARADQASHEAREERNFNDRYLAWTEDHTGMVTFSGKLDAVTAAPIRAVLEQMVTQQYRARRDQDPHERDTRTVGQMRADALFELARHALGCKETERSGVRTALVVRMDQGSLMSGRGLGRIDGIDTPVSAGAARRLMGDAGYIPEVLGGDSAVLDLGRTQRLFSPAQRIALLERDGGCAKCHAPPEHCEAHHIRWWSRDAGPTDIANGVMLCTRCHHDIPHDGWEIEADAKQVLFIPPERVDSRRRPIEGGIAAIDIGSIIGSDPPGLGEPLWPQVTAEDEAMVRAWSEEARRVRTAADELDRCGACSPAG